MHILAIIGIIWLILLMTLMGLMLTYIMVFFAIEIIKGR